MFLDASPKYTNSDINYKKENPIVVERFVQKARNISDYSTTKITINTNFSDYTYMTKEIKSAPEKLKRAMFRTSSKGIASALNKK